MSKGDYGVIYSSLMNSVEMPQDPFMPPNERQLKLSFIYGTLVDILLNKPLDRYTEYHDGFPTYSKPGYPPKHVLRLSAKELHGSRFGIRSRTSTELRTQIAQLGIKSYVDFEYTPPHFAVVSQAPLTRRLDPSRLQIVADTPEDLGAPGESDIQVWNIHTSIDGLAGTSALSAEPQWLDSYRKDTNPLEPILDAHISALEALTNRVQTLRQS